MPFANLLASIADDGERTSLETIATKYPSLTRYVELGQQVETFEPEIHEMYGDAAGLDAPLQEAKKWRIWKDSHWKDWQSLHSQTEADLEAARQTIARMEALGDTDMTSDEIAKIVNDVLTARGVVDKDGLQKELTDLLEKKVQPAVFSAANTLTTRFEDVFDKLQVRSDTHRQKFGETLKPREVFEYMKKNNISDPDDAYDKMYAGKFREAEQKEIDAKLAKAKEEGIAEGRSAAIKEVTERAPGGGSIVDGGGGGRRMGPLEKKRMERMTGKEGEQADVPLGKGIYRQAAAEYRQKEMSGTA